MSSLFVSMHGHCMSCKRAYVPSNKLPMLSCTFAHCPSVLQTMGHGFWLKPKACWHSARWITRPEGTCLGVDVGTSSLCAYLVWPPSPGHLRASQANTTMCLCTNLDTLRLLWALLDPTLDVAKPPPANLMTPQYVKAGILWHICVWPGSRNSAGGQVQPVLLCRVDGLWQNAAGTSAGQIPG